MDADTTDPVFRKTDKCKDNRKTNSQPEALLLMYVCFYVCMYVYVFVSLYVCVCLQTQTIPKTQPLFVLWQCKSQAWMQEEGNANGLSCHTVSLNCNYSLTHSGIARPKPEERRRGKPENKPSMLLHRVRKLKLLKAQQLPIIIQYNCNKCHRREIRDGFPT